METLPWFWIWVILTAALCIGEMFTVSFFLLPFAVGAGCAAIASVLGGDILVQFAVFIVVSVLSLVACRPLSKFISRGSNAVAGIDRLIGKQGKVIGSKCGTDDFRVLVAHETWNAVTENASVLPDNSSVEVLRIDGTHLVVRPVLD